MTCDDTDVHWMRRALQLADQAAAEGEVPVGALLVDSQGAMLGEGYNRCIGLHDPSAHAEIQALRAACVQAANYRLPGSTLYVTIEPCTMCFGALIHARVARLVLGCDEPRAGVVGSALSLHTQGFYNHGLTVTSGVLAGEAAEKMRDFFAARRRRS